MSFWFDEQSRSQLLDALKEIATHNLTTSASSIVNNSSHNASIVL